MSTRSKKYGFYFFCSMIFFSFVFIMLFAGLGGAFSSPETGTNMAAVIVAIPTGLGISFIVTILGLLWFICQEES